MVLAVRDFIFQMLHAARSPVTRRILGMTPDELRAFVEADAEAMGEEEVLAVLEHPYSSAQVVARIANQARLTSYYSVRAKLVAHRYTPRGHALKFVHYLFWTDLLRMSTNVHIPPAVRRAIDVNLAAKLGQLSVGEKISMARACTRELIPALLRDPSPRVLTSLMTNSRLTEEAILVALGEGSFHAEKLRTLAADPKWSRRYSIRLAVARHPQSPASTAASQLRHLRRSDLSEIERDDQVPLFVRRCAERMLDPRSEEPRPV